MVIVYSEVTKANFEGTVIDIETIGDFCRGYEDSREYRNMAPIIFGYIDKNGLKIHCAKKIESIINLKMAVAQIVLTLRKPLYAFNCCFEQGVLFHSCGITINFDGELNKERYELKKNAVTSLSIENYDDPFNDIGFKCKLAWEAGDTNSSIKHNRSCLLKERDILLRRGYRTPDDLILFSNNTKTV
jgi:hypothetical protein